MMIKRKLNDLQRYLYVLFLWDFEKEKIIPNLNQE